MKLKELILGYPDTGVVTNTKKEFDQVKFYAEYYKNLTPSSFDVHQKDEYIIIRVKPKTK